MKASESKTTTQSPHETSTDHLQLKEGGDSQFFSEKTSGNFFGGGGNGGEQPFFSSVGVQAKLTVGQPGDKYEQEADAMADQVVQKMESGATGGGIGEEEEKVSKKIQRKAIFESNEEVPQAQAMIQRSTTGVGEESVSPGLESQLNASKGKGAKLPEDTRSSMESAFGTDFSGVNIHTDSQAVQMNQNLGAQAFTHGSDVYFNKGKYDTGSSDGQHLLAHELTHVVQQGSSNGIQRSSTPDIQKYDDYDSDGSGNEVKMHIPDGTYVLEAANIPVSWSSAAFPRNAEIYGTASQFIPLRSMGLMATPHVLYDRKKGVSSGRDFRVVPGIRSMMALQAGKGSAMIQVYKDEWGSNPLILQTRIRFDTIPIIHKVGETSLVHRMAYDMDDDKHDAFEVVQGATSGISKSYSKSVTNGFSVSRGRSVTNTISSKISSEIGASIEIIKVGVGSEITASQSVTNSIAATTTRTVGETFNVTKQVDASEPGKYVILPTAKVWKTKIFISEFDETGRYTGSSEEYVYTFKYNEAASVLKLAPDGLNLIDSEGNMVPTGG